MTAILTDKINSVAILALSDRKWKTDFAERRLFRKIYLGLLVARVASVSVGFGSKQRDFWCFARAEYGERAKNEIWGWEKGRKETLAFLSSPPLPLLLLAPFFAPETLATQARLLVLIAEKRLDVGWTQILLNISVFNSILKQKL